MKSPAVYVFICCLFLPLLCHAQGLKFKGLEQPIDKRTSFNVFSSRSPCFKDSFCISFDLALYPESAIGYILRVKNTQNDRVYNLFYDGQGRDLLFILNDEGRKSLIRTVMPRSTIRDVSWIGVRIGFDLKGDSISLSIQDSSYVIPVPDLPDRMAPDINFGKSDYIVDVPSFAIRKLTVGNRKHYDFLLDETEGDVVYDTRHRVKGKVSNPEWLIKDSYEWKKGVVLARKNVACSGYDPARKNVYYFDRDSLFTYNVNDGTVESFAFNNRCPVLLTLGTNFIDTDAGRIYAYEVYYEKPEYRDSVTVASLDMKTLTWKEESKDRLPMQMHHHGAFYDAAKKAYVLFGGFGNMHYNGSMYVMNLYCGSWTALSGFSGERICPRYFTSVGYDFANRYMYVYGGMGNESGEQVVGRRYLYDLHRIDMLTSTVEKLWETDCPSVINSVPVRGMVIDDDGFYTLCYPESFTDSFLQLYRFSFSDGEYKVLGNRIPIHSDKITTNANLYYDGQLQKFIVTVQEFDDDDIMSTLKVYSLISPALSMSDLSMYHWKRCGGGKLL